MEAVPADDVSYPSHRYPTRWKLGLSSYPQPQVLRIEGKAKDSVLVPCKRRRDERLTFHLPQEIISNILLLIPAKVLHEVVRYVCKQWFNIVNDPMFVRLHSQMSSGGFLIQNPYEESKLYYIEEDTLRLKVTEIQIPLPVRIMGSFSGLVLLRDVTKPDIFRMVNPVTKVKFSLPPLTRLCDSYTRAGFRLDSSAHYKVFHIYVTAVSYPLQIRVFTVGVDMAWRFLDVQDLSINTMEKLAKLALKGRSRFIAGFIFWYNMPQYNCVALDVNTETFYEFSLPLDVIRSGVSVNPPRFVSTGTCLGVLKLKGDIWRFWKLTDVKTGEWTEVAGINLQAVLSRVDQMFYPSEFYCTWPVMLIDGVLWFYRRVDGDYLMFCYDLVSESFFVFPCDAGIQRHSYLSSCKHIAFAKEFANLASFVVQKMTTNND